MHDNTFFEEQFALEHFCAMAFLVIVFVFLQLSLSILKLTVYIFYVTADLSFSTVNSSSNCIIFCQKI